MEISAAGNTEIPAHLTLLQKGYAVLRISKIRDDTEIWQAKKDGLVATANSPIALLGLVVLAEARGKDWRASDSEIETFLSRFP